MKKVLGCIRRLDDEYNLIPNGRIAVGLSGGKDSLLLLHALTLYRRFSHKEYDLAAFTVDPGFSFDPTPLQAYCDQLGVTYHFLPGAVAQTAAEQTRHGTPCHLCARMRRGILYKHAAALNFDTVALAHHRDDALETLILSIFYEGRLFTLPPRTQLSRVGLCMIRPMLYLDEAHIIRKAMQLALPVVPSSCPFDGHSQRTEAKRLLNRLDEYFPNGKQMLFYALRHSKPHLWH